MKAIPNVSIIGTGALGSALAKACSQKNITILSAFNRSEAFLQKLEKEVYFSFSGDFPESTDQLGKLVFITVTDDRIEAMAKKLAMLSDSLKGYSFVHCSGNKSSEVLESLSKKGASVASFHPLQSVTRQSRADVFEDIYFDIEGDDDTIALLGRIAEKLGAEWFEISAYAKPYLHAAAVMASNYLISLLKTSSDIAVIGEIDDKLARKAILPLVKHTLENTSKSELSDALTGPIVRGDSQTVEEHIRILEHHPDLLTLYKKLGKKALELADIDNSVKKELGKLLG